MSRRAIVLVISVAVWLLGGFTLWTLLKTLEAGCKFQERASGLWAECFAPAAVVYAGLFAALLLLDIARIVIGIRAISTAKRTSND